MNSSQESSLSTKLAQVNLGSSYGSESSFIQGSNKFSPIKSSNDSSERFRATSGKDESRKNSLTQGNHIRRRPSNADLKSTIKPSEGERQDSVSKGKKGSPIQVPEKKVLTKAERRAIQVEFFTLNYRNILPLKFAI